MQRVQRFNIQGRICTCINYTLQFSSEPMRQLSMSLPLTNVSTHRFDYVASTALYWSFSQQRSYFSVLKQVAQASGLQQQLWLFLQDEDNPSLSTSLTSANFVIIIQKIGIFFSHSFLRLLLTVTDSTPQPESVELRPVLHSARAPVVEPQVAETQPLI